MFRSPPQLRSGAKGKAVALSTIDKKNTSNSPLSSTSLNNPTMAPPADDPKRTTVNLADIEKFVNKQLSSGAVFEALVGRLTERLTSVIQDAITAATAPFVEEVRGLREEISSLTTRVSNLERDLADRTDDLEQYQRRNNLRVFGVEETNGEDTNNLIKKLCQDQLGISLSGSALCRTHRVGRQPKPTADGRRQHRPIIVRFVSYQDRRQVFAAKKKLKGSGVTIREDLTARRFDLYKKAAEKFGFKNTWTQDGRVIFTDETGKRGAATRLTDIPSNR